MSNLDRTINAVIGHLSGVSLLVPVRTTSSVGWGRNTIKANASVVGLLVPVRTTTNVDRARKAVIANATVVRPLVSVRPMTSVTSERIVMGEFVSHTVFGAAELF